MYRLAWVTNYADINSVVPTRVDFSPDAVHDWTLARLIKDSQTHYIHPARFQEFESIFEYDYMLFEIQNLEGHHEKHLENLSYIRKSFKRSLIFAYDGDVIITAADLTHPVLEAALKLVNQADGVITKDPRGIPIYERLTSKPVFWVPPINSLATRASELNIEITPKNRNIICTPVDVRNYGGSYKNPTTNILVLNELRKKFPDYRYSIVSTSEKPDILIEHLQFFELDYTRGHRNSIDNLISFLSQSVLMVDLQFGPLGGALIVEASSCGCPVITARDTIAGDYLGNNVSNRRAFVEAVDMAEELLLDAHLWQEKAETARDRSQVFTAENIQEKFKKITLSLEEVEVKETALLQITNKKPRYVVAGGGRGYVSFTGDYSVFDSMIYGYEYHLASLNPETWNNSYISRDILVANPSLMDNVKLLLFETEYDQIDKIEIKEFIKYARSKKCVIGAQPNGGHGHLLTGCPIAYFEFFKMFDFIWLGTGAGYMADALEKITGVPCIASPPPYIEGAMNAQREQSEKAAFDLPKDIENKFILGKSLSSSNELTVQLAEHLNIPLIVTVWSPQYGSYLESLHNVETVPNLSQEQWLYLLTHSRGIFELAGGVSGGRHVLYAGVCGRPSLTTCHAWQEILFPEALLPNDIKAGIYFKDYEKKAIGAIEHLPYRLKTRSPENEQAVLEEFLASNSLL